MRASTLKPFPRNARTHTPAQISQIARSISEFGFTNPILIDQHNRIVAGFGRWAAVKELGSRDVPVIRLEDLTEAQIRAYAIADNRLAEKAGWDKEILALEFEELNAVDLDFDLEVTGFEVGEIDALVAGLEQLGGQHEVDETADLLVEIDRAQPSVSRPGDLWQLGRHRLLCGDARDRATLERLMAGSVADAVISDPPYNVRIDGFVSGKGRTKHREFAMASGEMSDIAFKQFLHASMARMIEVTTDNGLFYLCMDWRHIDQLVGVARELGLRLLNICVWVKPRGGMGSFYRSQHEFVAVLASEKASSRNNIQLGRFGRNRTNVWHYAGPNALTAEGREALALHPTVKPVALIADAILDSTPRDGLVLDPFAGSGTILIAAEKTGRRARALEIDPRYVDACVRRWQVYTGQAAVHAVTGIAFAAVSASEGAAGNISERLAQRQHSAHARRSRR